MIVSYHTPHKVEGRNPTSPNPTFIAIDSEDLKEPENYPSHSRYLAVNSVLLHWSAAL